MTPEEKLKDIAQQLRDGSKPTKISVRELLNWFDAQRRGYYIVERIRDALSDAGLLTKPDFVNAWIDGQFEFLLSDDGRKFVPDGSAADTGSARAEVASTTDPTNRIGKLAAANVVPTSVKPNDSTTTAITIMMKNDFSHLPVMTSERDVKGIVSWTSIGSRLALGKSCAEVRECMEPASVVSSDSSLFEAMDGILQDQYVLVLDDTKKVTGIVTTYDLSLQFRQLTEPFLLLGEIENHIRRVIERAGFRPEQLKECCDPGDKGREVARASDLSLGEYIRLLEEPKNWSQSGLPVDRKEFIAGLDSVRNIRNDVMHFEPDPLSPENLNTLRLFALFLRRLLGLVGY